MDLTTLTRVKEQIKDLNTDWDTWLQQAITGFSDFAEGYMNRLLESTSRAVEFFPFRGQRVFAVKGVPIASVTSFVDVDGNSYTEADDDFRLHKEEGLIKMRFEVADKKHTLTYTGGMAANVTALITAFPRLAWAADLQVAAIFQKRDELGGRSLSDSGGSIAFENPTLLLPQVKQVLDGLRIYGVA